MSDLVVGYDPPLLRREDAVLLLLADQDHLDSLEQILLADRPAAVLNRQDRGLVDHIGKVRSDRAGGRQRDIFKIDRVIHVDILRVNLQDRDAALEVRTVHDHAAVKAARTKQSRVEDLRAVGRRQDQDTLGGVEAVHLREQLVQGLFALVVAAEAPALAGFADRIDLIDENNTGCTLLGFLKEVAHTARADADEHLDELRTGQREERHVGLAGHGLREQGLAGTGRAD